MSDFISRADAIEAVRNMYYPTTMQNTIDVIDALPSAELPKGDLISRADVLKYPIRLDHYDEENGSREFVYGIESVIEYVESLPSADVVSREFYEDAVKANIGIVIENRKLKAQIESADAVSREDGIPCPICQGKGIIKRCLDVNANVVEVVRCKDCRHAHECHKSVQYTRNEPRTVTMGYSPIEWCSHGERREK